MFRQGPQQNWTKTKEWIFKQIWSTECTKRWNIIKILSLTNCLDDLKAWGWAIIIISVNIFQKIKDIQNTKVSTGGLPIFLNPSTQIMKSYFKKFQAYAESVWTLRRETFINYEEWKRINMSSHLLLVKESIFQSDSRKNPYKTLM